MQRICRKCGHVHKEATGAPMEACPSCGAIYSRVEAARAQGSHTPSQPTARSQPRAIVPTQDYLAALRRNSNYPTFRTVVGVFVAIGYLLAIGPVIAFVGAIRSGSTTGVLWSVFGFAAIIIGTRIFKEISFMIADGCDALVRLAELREPK